MAHLAWAVGEHDDMGAELGGAIDRVFDGCDGVHAPVEGMLRPRADLDARLLVELAVALDEAGLQRADDHRRRLVEALARFVHTETEGGELPPGQAAPETEVKSTLAHHVEHPRLFSE